jgi:hypothetical protein
MAKDIIEQKLKGKIEAVNTDSGAKFVVTFSIKASRNA